MSQLKQKSKDMERWPHVKRNWIKAIKAIQNGEGLSRNNWRQTPSQIPTKRTFGKRYNKTEWNEIWKSILGSSESSSSDRLTEEQENEIAENLFDWWISGKPYKQWYAEKFCQLKFDFKDEE